ncbi:MAG: sodium:solute symporter family transporter [Ruminococcus sp.]
MSTADSQLLVTASAVSEDLYHSFIKKDADTEEILKVSRITVIVIAVIAFVIAWNPDSSIMGLVSNAWAGLGSAFGPIVVMSLFWRRTNLPGAIAGMVTGGLTVIIWDYIPLVGGQTLGTYIRTLFPGSWFPAQSGDDRDRQPCYEGSIQRNHR